MKTILSALPLVLLLTVKAKTHCFFNLRFKLILQLISDISSDLQKLFRCSNATAIDTSSANPFAAAALPII